MQMIERAVAPELAEIIQLQAECLMNGRPPNQVIGRMGDPYLLRWMLSRKAVVPTYDDPVKLLELVAKMPSELENLYLHSYVRPDQDIPHDHPWPNVTYVVRGWYIEKVFDAAGCMIGAAERERGDIVIRAATDVHAIVETSADCVSLFATGRKCRDWGFRKDDGTFIPWQDFEPSRADAAFAADSGFVDQD